MIKDVAVVKEEEKDGIEYANVYVGHKKICEYVGEPVGIHMAQQEVDRINEGLRGLKEKYIAVGIEEAAQALNINLPRGGVVSFEEAKAKIRSLSPSTILKELEGK